MSETVVTLKLPESIYQQMRQIAEASRQPLEVVMVETFTLLADQALALTADTAVLDDYTDAQLWGVVFRHLPDHVNQRWQQLLKAREGRAISAHEQAELEQIVDMHDYYTLHRSQALVRLKRRGYDTDTYLKGH